MSEDDSEPSVSPDGFTDLAKNAGRTGAEKAKEKAGDKAREKAAEKVASAGGLPDGMAGKVAKALLKPDEGMSVEDVVKKYNCSEGAALTIRGITRAVGIDGVPPVIDIVVGLGKMASNDGEQ